ncbi:hypothetical protein C0J50_6594, partial [Silurus asotus]
KAKALSLPPHHPYDCGIDLLPGTAPPRGRLYHLTGPERKAMAVYIRESLASGIIHPSSSPAGAGFFFVEKKDKSLCPCINYRGLNSITIKNRYPLPLMSTAFELLQGATVFTKLDPRNAYQLALFNNILIYSRSLEEHRCHVRTVLTRLLQNHVCEGREMECSDGSGPKWPEPENRKQLQRFLGFANFYRKFITITAPLHRLTSTCQPFTRNSQAEQAFLELKTWFTSAHVFTLPDPSRQFVVEVDASDKGVGAILSQRARQRYPTATGSPMALPATFSSKHFECRGFLMQVNLYIEMQPQRFPTKRSKVAFFISLLSGKALAWAQSLWDAAGSVVNAYAPFTAHFLEVFSAASGVLTTADQLLSLRQGDDTITDYSLCFRTLAASSGWNESALLGVYRQGLSPEIRQAMAVYDDKVALEGFIQKSIGLSQRLAACSSTPPQPTPLLLMTPPGAQAAAGAEPMQLGFQRLSRRERNSRLVTGKCLIPEEYQAFKDVFCAKAATRLPPHRQLNSQIAPLPYPLPLVPATLEDLREARVFTKLDFRSAYNLVRIRKGDEWKTDFITPSGHYEYRVMPYGLSISPAVFQGFMNEMLRPYLQRFVMVYIDDILIYSRNMEEHHTHVRQVLGALRSHHLYLNHSKCEFHRPQTHFLGYVISARGIQMDEGKVKAVWDWPIPETIKELQRFLGFANFYRRFIQGYSRIAAPLTSLLRGYNPQFNGQAVWKILELNQYLRIYCSQDQGNWCRFLPWAKYAQNSLRQDTTGLTRFQCMLGFQPPLFPWSNEPSNVPAVDAWFRESNRVWESAHTQLHRAVRNTRRHADARRLELTRFRPGDRVWLSTRDLMLKLPCRDPAAPVQPEVVDQPEVYAVQEVLDSRWRGGRLENLVDWEGYGPEERSWVARQDVLDLALLEVFHTAHPHRPLPRARGWPCRRVRASGVAPEGGGGVREHPASLPAPAPPTRSCSPDY